MDRLRQLLHQLNEQLGLLTVSQRIAIGLCAALVATSLLWLLRWSAVPDMVPLPAVNLTLDDVQAAEEALKASNVRYEIRGATQIYVREDDKYKSIRILHQASALPAGTLFDMGSMVAENNPFLPPAQLEFNQTFAKGNELAKIISTYPFVASARVLISPPSKRRLGGESDVPTASVSVELTRDTELTMQTVDGFARLVAGAVQGLKPHNVTVTDARTGRSFSPPRPEDAGAFAQLDEARKREEHFHKKIMDRLAYIPGVRAAVTVELDTDRRSKTIVKHDKPQLKMDSSREQEHSTEQQPAESSLQANTGTAITAGPAGQASSETETQQEFFDPKMAQTEVIESMPFTIKGVTATVSIPRSFIVGLYKAKKPGAEEPTDQDIQTERDAQVASVRGSVEKIIMARSQEDVTVDVYPDITWESGASSWSLAPGGLAAADQASAGATTSLLKTYGPQAGLGLLALCSLFMMLRIVKKSSDALPRRKKPGDAFAGGEDYETVLSVGQRAVGEAETTDGFLTGREIDDRTMKDQQLSEEVARLVEDDPRIAADLLRRWVEDGD